MTYILAAAPPCRHGQQCPPALRSPPAAVRLQR